MSVVLKFNYPTSLDSDARLPKPLLDARMSQISQAARWEPRVTF